MTTTPNLGLTKPTVGADADTWGAELNTDLDTIDTFAAKLMPGAEVTIASASTCDIGSAISTAVAITGTVAINSFGTVPNCIRIVRYTGALNVVYNATSLILLGGGTRGKTAAGDIAIYKSDGSGNWRELYYHRAGTANRTPIVVSDPAGTTSTSYVMMGLGILLTPFMSTTFRVFLTGTTSNTTSAQDNSITMRSGTGSAPANGAAVTGTVVSTKDKRITIPGNGYFCDFTYYGEFSGTLGSANWFDLALKVGTGTGTITNIQGYIEEIPDY